MGRFFLPRNIPGFYFFTNNLKNPRRQTMQKLKRNINMGFRVTEQEQRQIRQRMAELGINNLRAYLLKMALNGYIVNLDLSEINECSRLLRLLGNNVNQIARHANTLGAVYESDLADIKAQLDAIWKQQDKIIRSLAKVLEAA
jgi:hypothetical protein